MSKDRLPTGVKKAILVSLACLITVLNSCKPKDSFSVSLEKGQGALNKKKYNSAILHFKNAVSQKEGSHIAHTSLADAYYQSGKRDKALKEYRISYEILKKRGLDDDALGRTIRLLEKEVAKN